MRKAKMLLVAAIVTGLSMLGAAPSGASTCASDIEDVCRVAGTVICKVVTKGQPCLM